MKRLILLLIFLFVLQGCDAIQLNTTNKTTSTTNPIETTTELDTDSIQVSLKGGEELVIEVAEDFIDPGLVFNVEDNEDLYYEVEGAVENIEGDYKLTYSIYYKGVLIDSLERIVRVEDLSPDILFEGKIIYKIGEDLPDYNLYVQAFDSQGMDISGQITYDDSNINYQEPGEYRLYYMVEDLEGREKQISVYVHVYDTETVLINGYSEYETFINSNFSNNVDIKTHLGYDVDIVNDMVLSYAPYYGKSGGFLFETVGGEFSSIIDFSILTPENYAFSSRLFSYHLSSDFLFISGFHHLSNIDQFKIAAIPIEDSSIDLDNILWLDYQAYESYYVISSLYFDQSTLFICQETNLGFMVKSFTYDEVNQTFSPANLIEDVEYEAIDRSQEYVEEIFFEDGDSLKLIVRTKKQGQNITYNKIYVYDYSGSGLTLSKSFEIQLNKDTNHLENSILYGHYLILSFPDEIYKENEDNYKRGRVFIIDLSKEVDDQGFILMTDQPQSFDLDSFGHNLSLMGQDLYVVGYDYNDSYLFKYNIDDLLNGEDQNMTSQLIDEDHKAMAFAISSEYLAYGFPYTKGTLYQSGHVDLYEIDKMDYPIYKGQLNEYNDNVIVKFDGQAIDGFFNGDANQDGIYNIKIYDGDYIDIDLEVILDLKSMTILNDTLFTNNYTYTVEADEDIYYYSIGQINYDYDNLIEANQAKSFDISLEEEGHYYIVLYDRFNKETYMTIYNDASEPTFSQGTFKDMDHVPEAFEILEDSPAYLGGSFVVSENYLLVKTKDSKISLYENNEGQYKKVRDYISLDDTYSDFGDALALSNQYVMISAKNQNNDDVVFFYDILDANQEAIKSLIIPDGELLKIDASDDYFIGIYNMDGQKKIYSQSLSDLSHPYEPLPYELDFIDYSLYKGYLALSRASQNILVYDLKTMDVHELEGAFSYGYKIGLSEGMLASFGQYGDDLLIYRINMNSLFLDYEKEYLHIDFEYKFQSIGQVELGQGHIAFSRGSSFYLLDLNADDIESGLQTYDIKNPKFEFNESALLIGVNAISIYRNTGKIIRLPLYDYQVLSVDDDYDVDLFLVKDGHALSIDNNYLIEENGVYEFYAIDQAGNRNDYQLDVNSIKIDFYNMDQAINDLDYLIQTSYPFNQVSIDGGLTFTDVQATSKYLISFPQEGDYHMVVKNTLLNLLSGEYFISVDTTRPEFNLIYNDELDLVEEHILDQIPLPVAGQVYNTFMHDEYLIVSFAGRVVIYKLDDLTDYFMIEPEIEDDLFGFTMTLSDDLLFIGHPNDIVDGIKRGSLYIYDLSQEAYDQMFLNKIVSPDMVEDQGFGSSILFKDKMLFVGAISSPTIRNSGIVYQYDYLSENKTFEYKDYFLGSQVESNHYFGDSLAYDHFKLVITTNGYGKHIYVYDLLKNPSEEGYETIIDKPHRYSSRFGYSISLYENLLAVYELGTYTTLYDEEYSSIYIYDLSQENPNELYYHKILNEVEKVYNYDEGIEFLGDGNIFSSIDQAFYDTSDFRDGIDESDQLKLMNQIDEDKSINRYNSFVSANNLYYFGKDGTVGYLNRVIYHMLEIDVSDNSQTYIHLLDDQGGGQVVSDGYFVYGEESFEFYYIDQAGNSNTVVVDVDTINPVISNINKVFNENPYILTSERIHQISFDGGLTFTDIEPTKNYSLDHLSDGVYLICVKDLSGNISKTEIIIIDTSLPTYEITTSSQGTLSAIYEIKEDYYNRITQVDIYEDTLYYTNDFSSSTLYGLDLSKDTIDRYYNYEINRLSSLSTSVQVYGDLMIVTNYASLSDIIDIYDLSKDIHQDGYHRELRPHIELDQFEYFGHKAFLMGTKLLVLLEGGSQKDSSGNVIKTMENRIFVYDLSLSEDDENYVIELDNSYFKDYRADHINFYEFEDQLMIHLRVTNIGHTSIDLHLYDLELPQEDPNFYRLKSFDIATMINEGGEISNILSNGNDLLLKIYYMHEPGDKKYQYLFLDDYMSPMNPTLIPDYYSSETNVIFNETKIVLEDDLMVKIYDIDQVNNGQMVYDEIMVDVKAKKMFLSEDERRLILVTDESHNYDIYEYYLEETQSIDFYDHTIIKSIEVLLDSQEISLNHLNELTEIGHYAFMITDMAGNTIEFTYDLGN